MTSENFEFSDITDQKYNSETKLTTMEGRKTGSGCYITTAVGLFLIILGVLLAVAVGLIVFFAVDARDLVCQCSSAEASVESIGTAAMVEKCKDMAEEGNVDICNSCPSPTSSLTTAPPSMTTAPPTTKPKVTDVRLPTSVMPIHYTVRLQPYMYQGDVKDFSFKGYTSIVVRCVEPTDNITLHINALTIDPETVQFAGLVPMSNDATLLKTERDEDREFFILRLSANMQKNREYTVSMNYTGPLKDTLKGLYLSSYSRNNDTVYLATTQFQPTDARRAFPCFDEPAIKAKFNVTLVRKADLISISNTPIIDSSEKWTEDGIQYVADVYDESPKMSTYLLAFIVCDFEYTAGNTSNGIRYRAFARPEVKNSTLYALDVGVKVLPYFETYFNTTYPLPKQDMIAIPDFAAGAMENWGLITYRETAMLFSDGISNAGNKERVAIVVSHELAHQWFGDLVTPSWWDDLWLNEGFATFVEYMGVDFVHKEWNMWDKFVISDVQNAFNFDGLITSHPVYVPVNHPDEINEIFDTVSYSKGGSIIRMMRHFLGFETFRKGLVKYLHRKAFDAAFHDDLWQALEDQAMEEGKTHLKVKEIMDTWTLQMNYPVITVTRDFHDMGLVHVTQSRYLVDQDATDPGKYDSKFGYKWTIPITLTSSQNPNFIQNDTDVHWMTKDETSTHLDIGKDNLPDISNKDGWILCNTEQNGFYRVNYQLGNWKALTKQLETDHKVISTINRAQIINDAWNLAKPGALDIVTALNTANYLDKEMDYVPWNAAIDELAYVGRMISLTSTYGLYHKFIREKSARPFSIYALDNTNATHVEKYARGQIARIACSYGNENCTQEAVKQFKEWMGDRHNNKIDPNLKSTIYCSGIQQGGLEEWEFALEMYLETNIASEKALLLSAMSCSSRQWILSHYLNLILEKDSPIRKQDALSVIGNIGGSSTGRLLTWQFYREHFDQLSDDFSASFFSWSRLVGELTKSFNTEFQLNEVRDFMNLKRESLGTAVRAFEQAMETINSNRKWMTKNYALVENWFKSKQ